MTESFPSEENGSEDRLVEAYEGVEEEGKRGRVDVEEGKG